MWPIVTRAGEWVKNSRDVIYGWSLIVSNQRSYRYVAGLLGVRDLRIDKGQGGGVIG